MIENASQYSNWEFGIGKVTEEMILDYMPLPSDKDSMICICGSREMIKNHLKPMLKNLNYKEENLLMFD